MKNEMSFQFPADKCTNIKTIGKPVAHNSRHYHQGAWMKDPLEIMGAETIFVMEGSVSYTHLTLPTKLEV